MANIPDGRAKRKRIDVPELMSRKAAGQSASSARVSRFARQHCRRNLNVSSRSSSASGPGGAYSLRSWPNHLLRLAECDRYRDRVAVLVDFPGIGILAAMAILVELQDIERSRKADQLASYFDLTPSQHSSGDRLHHGRITCCGNASGRSFTQQIL